MRKNIMKLNEKTGLYENYGLWHVPFWQTREFKIGVYVFLGLLVLCIIALIVKKYCAYRRRKKLSVWDQALAELAQLKKDHKIDILHGKEFYTTTCAILKKYLHDRFGYDVMGKTDDEVIEYLRSHHQDDQMLEDIKSILQGGVIIKFANAQAGQEQIEGDYSRAVAIIRRTIPEKKQ